MTDQQRIKGIQSSLVLCKIELDETTIRLILEIYDHLLETRQIPSIKELGIIQNQINKDVNHDS